MNAVRFIRVYRNSLCCVTWCYFFLTSREVLENRSLISSLLYHCLFILNTNVTECHWKHFCIHSSPRGLWKGQGSWLDFALFFLLPLIYLFNHAYSILLRGFVFLWFHFHFYKYILLTEMLNRFRAGKVTVSISRAIYNHPSHIDSRYKGRGNWNRNLIQMCRCKPGQQS